MEEQEKKMELESLESGASAEKAEDKREKLPIDFLSDVELEFEVILGSAKCTIRDLLSLSTGSIVELNRSTGEALDLLLNGKLFAKCEVLVVDEKFGVRITEVIDPDEK